MARRRSQEPGPDAPPDHFVYARWADEKADGPMPAWWNLEEKWMWHKIRAFKRYLLAKHSLRELADGGLTHSA